MLRCVPCDTKLLDDPKQRQFAFDRCLQGLDDFKMNDDRNGVATRGLLFMEGSWDTAYLWENAEAALAYFEAAHDLRHERPAISRQYATDGLVILRTIAKHHYGDPAGWRLGLGLAQCPPGHHSGVRARVEVSAG